MRDLFSQINGINICYNILGTGYPLILIHGYAGHKEDWLPQIIELSKHFKIIYFDNRCSGKSDHPNEPITMQMFINDLKGLMDALEINRAHIVGRSLGGMIAQEFLLLYPHKVNKAILINTHYSGEMGDIIVHSSLNSQNKSYVDLEERFWNDAMFLYHSTFRRKLKKNPNKKFYNLFTLKDLIENLENNEMSKDDLINQGHAFKNFNTINDLHKIQKHILLIGASHDRIFPNSRMFEMHRILPNSRLEIIEKAGHGSPVSKAPEINNLIIKFLKL